MQNAHTKKANDRFLKFFNVPLNFGHTVRDVIVIHGWIAIKINHKTAFKKDIIFSRSFIRTMNACYYAVGLNIIIWIYFLNGKRKKITMAILLETRLQQKGKYTFFLFSFLSIFRYFKR